MIGGKCMTLIEDRYYEQFKEVIKKDTGKQYAAFRKTIEDNLKENEDAEEIKKRISIRLEILKKSSDDNVLVNFIQQLILIITVLFTIVSNFMLEFKNNEINMSFVSFITIVLLITVIYTGGVSIYKLYENQTRVNKIVYYKEILDILNEK